MLKQLISNTLQKVFTVSTTKKAYTAKLIATQAYMKMRALSSFA